MRITSAGVACFSSTICASQLVSNGVINWNGQVGALSYGSGFVTLETNSSTCIQFKTNGTAAMNIDTGQNVGIGIAPKNGDGKLQMPLGTAITFGNSNSVGADYSWISDGSYNFSSGNALVLNTEKSRPVVIGTCGVARFCVGASGVITTTCQICTPAIYPGFVYSCTLTSLNSSLSNTTLTVNQRYGDVTGTGDYQGGGIALMQNNGTDATWAGGVITATVGTTACTGGYPGGLAFWVKSANNSVGYSGLSQAMRIDWSGRVGIGTTTPSAALNVSCVPSSYFGIIETTGTSTGTVKHFRVHKPNCVEYGIGVLDNNAFHISTASTFPTGNGFTIASNGYVGIGQCAPGGRLEIMNCSATTWSIIARHAVSSGILYGILSTIQNQAPNNTSNYLFYGDDNQQARMIVYSNGTVSNATGTYNTIASDIRLKQDITNASSQWCDIKNLRLVNFRFKKDVEYEGDSALRHLGLIAQEVEETSPNLVEDVTDRCGNTNKTIKTSIIHLKAVKALQEAMCRIEIQEDIINILKSCAGIS